MGSDGGELDVDNIGEFVLRMICDSHNSGIAIASKPFVGGGVEGVCGHVHGVLDDGWRWLLRFVFENGAWRNSCWELPAPNVDGDFLPECSEMGRQIGEGDSKTEGGGKRAAAGFANAFAIE